MKLLTLDNGAGGAPGVLLADGQVLDLRRAARAGTTETWLPASVRALLEAGDEGLAVARGVVDRIEAASADERAHLGQRGVLLPGADARLLAPVPEPRMVLAAGLAFRSHLAEMSGTPAPPHPTAFLKSPTSVTGSGAEVKLPPGAAEHVDYEGELAVVFGRECHAVDADEAMQYVAGYSAANDISARDWVRDVWGATTPWDARRTWEVNLMGKQFPGFTALGPVLLTRDEVPDLAQLKLETRLNGTVMQSTSMADMIFELPDVIAWFSRWYRFTPGDVLLSGTPAGVGVGRKPPVFLHAGDTIEVEISGVGTLRNPIRAA